MEINLRHIGWTLEKLDLIDSKDVRWGFMLRGLVKCPCGGYECFCSIVDGHDKPEELATNLLSLFANKAHLQDDVDKGTLPPFDIEKHIFKKLITEEQDVGASDPGQAGGSCSLQRPQTNPRRNTNGKSRQKQFNARASLHRGYASLAEFRTRGSEPDPVLLQMAG